MISKTCSRCQLTKPVEEFNRTRSRYPSHQYCRYCRACQREAYKEWAINNHAYKLRQVAKWQVDHREEIAEYDRKQYLNGKKERTRQIVRANKERYNTYDRKHRALKANSPGSHSAKDVESILIKQAGRCNACNCPMHHYHVDHIIPLVRGGSNGPENLQLLCAFCNVSKASRDWDDFLVCLIGRIVFRTMKGMAALP